MTDLLTNEDRQILEKTTPVYTATLVDEDEAPILLLSISTMVLTYKDRRTGATINSRADQDVKNANNVTIHANTGLLTWSMQSADTALVTTGNFAEDELEEHIATFTWTLTNGKVGRHITRFFIVQVVAAT